MKRETRKEDWSMEGEKRHPTLPPLFPLWAGRTGQQRIRLFAISPGSASECLSFFLFCVTLSLPLSLLLSAHSLCWCWSPVVLLICSSHCVFLLHPIFSVFCLPSISKSNARPSWMPSAWLPALRFLGTMTMFSSSPISASSHH